MLHHAGRLLGAADLALPVVLREGGVPLEAVVAGHGVVGGGHVGGALRGVVLAEAVVVAEVVLAEADSVVQTVPEHAVLADLNTRPSLLS